MISASWLNMVERFFRDLTANRIRRGVFATSIELVTAMEDYVDSCKKVLRLVAEESK
jgi:hypothetical protein